MSKTRMHQNVFKSSFPLQIQIAILIFLQLSVYGFHVRSAPQIARRYQQPLKSSTISTAQSVPKGSDSSRISKDLTGYKLWVTFTGFGVENMTCGIDLNDKFEVTFSRGISSIAPGFWRIVKYDDGRETIEATQPIHPEYMLFFDIWEKSILWRGNLDMNAMKVVDGLVITNKKKFGIFPYTETLAQFTADIYPPDKKLPDVYIPKFSDQQFCPPDDFTSPNDMKRYPEIFDPEFVDWWFSVEDALARGEEPPARPKPFFSPNPNAKAELSTGDADEQIGGKLRQRRGPTGSLADKK